VPQHILHYFPFAALVTQVDKADKAANSKTIAKPRFLLDEPYALIAAPSLVAWDMQRRQPAAMMTALNIPFTLMLIGIVLRGSAFIFRKYDIKSEEVKQGWSLLFGAASFFTPFIQGAVLGALSTGQIRIVDGRVVSGFFAGWLTPFALACGLFAVPLLAKNLATGTGGLVYTGSFHQLGVQALGIAVVGVWTFSACFTVLWAMKKLWGIRVHEEAETLGLDVSEHGMWGYPEFYIPVPGGYGTQSHGHLGSAHVPHAPAPAHAMSADPVPAP
jgi:hypothetical protein